MNVLKKIAGINLVILLVVAIGCAIMGASEHGQYKGLGAMIMMAIAVGLHTGILVLISLVKFVSKQKEEGRAYLLSSLLVLVIGFSACFGIASLF